jgi:hypothetical protein
MKRSRREALASLAGMMTIAGCGQPGDSWALDEQSTAESDMVTLTDGEIAEPVSPDLTFEDVATEYDADIYILASDERFRAVDAAETEVARADDLGGVINNAQASLSSGSILVATAGSLGTAIEQANGIVISGLDGRVALTPTEDAGGSDAIYRAAGGTSSGQFTSFGIDMQYQSGAAIRADGATDLTFDDIQLVNAGDHGVRLTGAASVAIRNSGIERASTDAVSMANCSDVQIEACEVTDSNHAVSAAGSSSVTITDVTAREMEYSAFALQNYTTDWEVSGCTAVNSGNTPFAASVAPNGAFVDCEAVGTTSDGEGGFEIEYNADSDEDNQQNPIVGCSVESCTARNCNIGFYAREDDSNYDTDTPVVRPRFVDCTATDCATGLFIGDTVTEAIIENFDPVDCGTDMVDNGVRTIIDGVSENEGSPTLGGQWFGRAGTARELDVVVEDTETGTQYEATATGGWEEV